METPYVIIPQYICKDTRLSSNDKILAGLVLGLSSKSGWCWASNEYFKEEWGFNTKQVQRSFSKLEKLELLERCIEISEIDGFTRSRKCRLRGDKNVPHEVSKVSFTRCQKRRIDIKYNNNKIYNNKINKNTDENSPETTNPPLLENTKKQPAEEQGPNPTELPSACAAAEVPVKKPISREWTELVFTKDEAQRVRNKFSAKQLSQKDIDYAVLQLRIWAENNPVKWAKKKSPYLNLIGWPLDKAVENKTREMNFERSANYLVKSDRRDDQW